MSAQTAEERASDVEWFGLLVDQLVDRCKLGNDTVTAALYGYVNRRRGSSADQVDAALARTGELVLERYLLQARRCAVLGLAPYRRNLLQAAVYVVTGFAVPIRRHHLEAGELVDLVDMLDLNPREDPI